MTLNHISRGRLLAAAAIAIAAVIAAAMTYFSTRREASPVAALLAFENTAAAATPTDRRIQLAQQFVKRAPAKAEGYNQLCAAFLQKARETEDAAFSRRAEAALKRSLELDPNVEDSNFDALKLQTMLLLNQHRFRQALDAARRAQRLRQRDYQVYGLLADALVELGDYAEAVEAADRMAELRPSAAAYARISYLRALHGHTEPALEAMRLALQTTSPADAEGVAWTRVHLGRELARAGRWPEAEREFDAALHALPDYGLALEAKAAARAAAGDFADAIEIYRRVLERKLMPDILGAIGDLYARLGQAEEARRQYAQVEKIEQASAESEARHLAMFWADHDLKLDEALALARRERAARADVYTCDLLAWCLYKKGLFAEARTAIAEAMRIGTRDAQIYYHAGMIHLASGAPDEAVKFLKLALATDAAFDPLQSDIARRTLKTLSR